MLLIFSRLFLRVLILFVAVFSIFYFYILWYRFDSNIWFVQTSWVYSLEKLDLWENEKIILNWQEYNLSDNKIILHNIFLKKSCWELKVWKFSSYECYNDNGNHIVYISKNIVKLTPVTTSIFKKLDLYSSDNLNIKYYFYWKNIKILYYRNWDIIYDDDLSSKKLINIPWLEFIWYTEKGLYVIKDNKLYFMRLSK